MPGQHASRTASGWLYRALLLAYPVAFRDEYGRELCLVFADQCRQVQSFPALLAVWAEALIGILKEAPKEHLHMIVQDLRYATRVLRKDLVATVAAIAILALGIGSTTLVFSLANGLLIRPLPYPRPDRLVEVEEYSLKDPNEKDTISFPNYTDMRARTRLLEDIGVVQSGETTLLGTAAAERLPMGRVNDGVFRVLGVAPLLGRAFSREDCLPKGPRNVVISADLWRRRFGGDPNIVGRPLDTMNDRYTIVGVMPQGFHYPARAEAWFPIQLDASREPRTNYSMSAIARLKLGVSVEQASDEVKSLLEQIHRENPANNGWGARATPIRDSVAGPYRKAVLTLLVAVGFLLLIACTNVSNLLLVKGTVRMREMAMRAAMGASRNRLVRQLISESLLLGVAGGALGVALAYLGIPALFAFIPVELPMWMSFSIDLRVLGFAVAASLFTSVAFGMVPAWASSRVDLASTLKEGGRGGSSGTRQKILRNGLVIAEVALSVTLLVGSGLMIRSFVALRRQDVGYRPDHVLSLSINYSEKEYPDGPKARAMVDSLTAEIASLPGVESNAFATEPPMDSSWTRIFTIEGRPRPLKDMPFVNHFVVGPGYFRTLGIPLLQGRDLAGTDFDTPVLVVARSFAAKHWPNENAVGKRVRFGPPERNEPWFTVVGVVADVLQHHLKTSENASVYLPYGDKLSVTPSAMLIRTAGDPLRLAQAVRERIARFDPGMAISQVFSLDQLMDRDAWQDRFFALLLGAFAGFALLLTAVGLYAVLSYTVSLHTHEIGIRMALGASVAGVRFLVMKQGMTLAGAGLLAGTAAALALTRFLESQLFRIRPGDPATYAASLATLVVVAGAAAFLPARRATGVDPATALRHE